MRTCSKAAHHAAILSAWCGVVSLLAVPLSGSGDLPFAVMGIACLCLALVAARLPWHRWGERATLGLGVPGFVLIAAANVVGLAPPRALSVMYVVVFVWVGTHHRRWQSLWLAPFAAGAYAGAAVLNDHGTPLDLPALLLVSVVLVVVAETVAQGLERLRASEAEMRFLVEHTTDLVTRVGMDGVIRYVSPSVHQVLGWRQDQVTGHDVSDFGHPDDPAPHEQAQARPGEAVTVVRRLRRADGAWAWLETVAKVVTGPEGQPEVLTSARDVTRWREAEEQLEHVATHDALTGLPNRVLLGARLERATSGDSDGPVTVAFVDLDGFKAVNDAYGHLVGDQLLVQVGRRLERATREHDTVTRYGGDEFVLVVLGLHDAPARQALARRVETDLSRPYRIGDLWVQCGASVGVTVAAPGVDAEDVVAEADRSMYAVKASRRPAGVPVPRPACHG